MNVLSGHEDDMVIELANEVRKVLGIAGIEKPKEKRKLIGPSHIPLKSHMSSIKILPLQGAVATDS